MILFVKYNKFTGLFFWFSGYGTKSGIDVLNWLGRRPAVSGKTDKLGIIRYIQKNIDWILYVLDRTNGWSSMKLNACLERIGMEIRI
jgi:hypothetical protein